MTNEQSERVVWVKDCQCHARATSGAIRMTSRYDKETCSHHMTATLYPMFSCDECGKPWKLEAPPGLDVKGGM